MDYCFLPMEVAAGVISVLQAYPQGSRYGRLQGAKQSGVTRLFCLTANTTDIYPGLTGFRGYSLPKAFIAWILALALGQ